MPPHGLHVFLGSDRPQKLRRIHDIARTLRVQALDRHQVDATTMSASELIALCRQHPAVSPVRLIVVDQAHRIDSAGVAAMRAHAAAIAQTACVILLVETELNARHPLSQGAKDFVVERFERRADPAAKPFALTDALGRQDAPAALVAVREQLVEGKDPIELLGLIVWQVSRWVVVKRMLQGGHRAEHIATVSGWRPWQIERLQSEVSGRSLGSLQQMLSRCWQLDGDMKRGRTAPEMALEGLVAELCLRGGGSSEPAHQA
jgi:DNA polymerase III delta subunit